jgi:membrane protease YdiL (CAAX protease family)
LKVIGDMAFGTKHLIIAVIVALLIFPIFFGVYIDFLFISELSINIVLFLIVGFLSLLGLGKLMETFGYSERSKEAMRQHDVVNALLKGEGVTTLVIFFPLTMVMEELIFRYYLIGILLNELTLDFILAIVLSSIIFSIYHIHIWFKFKDKIILISYLITSFLLGIYNGFILLNLGIFACIILHTGLVFILYYNLYKKLSK